MTAVDCAIGAIVPWFGSKRRMAATKEIVGDHVWAFEVFPPADRLVNQAPMRWFWVLPDFQEVLPVGLHRKGMVGEEMGDGS